MAKDPSSPKNSLRARRARLAVARVAQDIVLQRTQDVDMDALAADLHYSASHLRALFRGLSGEPAGQTAKRLRLDRAAVVLRMGHGVVRDVSRRSGYASTEAFTRAFKSRFGVTPGRFARGDPPAAPMATPMAIGLALRFHIGRLAISAHDTNSKKPGDE